jgi:cytochrome P450
VGLDAGSKDFFTDPELAADPYGFYERLGSEAVQREPYPGYDEFTTLCRDDREHFSACNVVSGPFPGLPVDPEGDDISNLIDCYRDSLPLHEYFASFDSPRHTDHRALLARLLSPKRLNENEEYLWRLADQTIETFADTGECEFVDAYGNPFTMLAIADLLGVPEDDRSRVRRAPELVGDLEGSSSNFIGVKQEWFVDYVEDRRRYPRNDVLTKLAQATFPDGRTPEPLEVARVAVLLFAAGQGTTVDLLSAAMKTLAEQPDLQDRLRADRTLIQPFIEEVLRLESPVKTNFRLARKTTTLGTTEVRAGTNVLAMVGAANRDPRRFEHPAELRLNRPNIGRACGLRQSHSRLPGSSAGPSGGPDQLGAPLEPPRGLPHRRVRARNRR